LPSNREEGLRAEEAAVGLLSKRGYKVIERNFRSPLGEIDIVAEEGGFLVFVEVKARNSPFFGDPLEAITETKKRHIIRTALFYMKKHRWGNRRARFDVVGIAGDEVKLVKNAFLIEGDDSH
jgi:putative endonuclease